MGVISAAAATAFTILLGRKLYRSFRTSVPPRWTQVDMICELSVVLLTAGAALAVCLWIGWLASLDTAPFDASAALIAAVLLAVTLLRPVELIRYLARRPSPGKLPTA